MIWDVHFAGKIISSYPSPIYSIFWLLTLQLLLPDNYSQQVHTFFHRFKFDNIISKLHWYCSHWSHILKYFSNETSTRPKQQKIHPSNVLCSRNIRSTNTSFKVKNVCLLRHKSFFYEKKTDNMCPRLLKTFESTECLRFKVHF